MKFLSMNQKLSRFSKTAGPGVLFACTAIGVSHLVQSTRAGADYGLLIIGFVILITLLKYPFFEYGWVFACLLKQLSCPKDRLDGQF